MHGVASGSYEEAIEAKREAIAAGYSSEPDPEADIAECLLAAGRRVEAERLYAELRARDPEDVWLNNSAAYAYRGIDEREALRWSLDGIDLAISTGDHDQVIGQLLDCAERSWDALGEAADQAVIDRVEAFQRSWVRPPWRIRWPKRELQPEQPCTHCGWEPSNDRSGARTQPAARTGPTTSTEERSLPVAVAWFPNTVGEAIRWPPGRNAPCWCGSGRKYKQCCGPTPPSPDE